VLPHARRAPHILGARSPDFENVARTSAVTPGFGSGTLNSLSPNGGTKLGSINRSGDYDVFATSVNTKRWLRVKVGQNGSDVRSNQLTAARLEVRRAAARAAKCPHMP
jgi:hypothetical protein